MSKFNIDMPDDLEIQNQIFNIVEEGLSEKEKFHVYLLQMYKNIGIKNLFHDSSEIYFICVIAIFAMVASIYTVTTHTYMYSDLENYIYMAIFTMSPLLYLSTNMFSFININENKTYEQEMVCKYNIYQVTALRMLIFSIVSIFSNMIVLIPFIESIDLFRGIMISISSLFLFSNLFLFLMLQVKSKYSKYLGIGLWIFTSWAISYIDSNLYNNLLLNLPIYIYIGVTTICSFMYIRNIKKLEEHKYEPFGV